MIMPTEQQLFTFLSSRISYAIDQHSEFCEQLEVSNTTRVEIVINALLSNVAYFTHSCYQGEDIDGLIESYCDILRNLIKYDFEAEPVVE